MKTTPLILALIATAALSACTWETYAGDDGRTHVRQKYPTGTGIYYTNGAASQNTHYHSARPEPHAILPSTGE